MKLQNREGVNYTRRLPEVVEAAGGIPYSFTGDGEAVYINPTTGKCEFTPCQRRCSTTDYGKMLFLKERFPITAVFFDLLSFKGKNIENEPLCVRKRHLMQLIKDYQATLPQYAHSTLFAAPCETVKRQEAWARVLKFGLEGLVVKDLESPYEHRRSWKWIKIKNWREMVCDVVGFKRGKGTRTNFFSSLVLAKDGKYVGSAGSGFNDVHLRVLKDHFSEQIIATRPFDIGEPYIPVKTSLQVEVKYYQLTENGIMRFPVFRRITAPEALANLFS